MLKVENLSVNYGGIKAVKSISFSVNEGEIVTLIGANGAGKSTTLRSISGLVKSTSGKVSFFGEDITNADAPEIVKKNIIMCPEGRRIFPDMTVLENIKIGAYTRTDNIDNDIEHMYDLFPILKDRNWQLAGTLSGGEQQMLAVARSLMSRPKLLMLDEPSLGLAPIIVNQIFEIIKKINEEGVTILLVEQNANMALKIADKAYLLETGSMVLEGTGKEFLSNEKIKEAYLGKKK
ncbi:MAG: ABC transporter ATP-binding protein [Lachnospiraceae bacterium]|nr:ABC transporter ATP-binding protein [Lachnospiraceae bacterium]